MKRLIILTYLLSVAPLLMAQNTIQSVVSSANVAAYERFNFEIILNNNSCDATVPDFGGLEIVGGPHPSQFNSTQYINGVRTQKIERRYTYQLRAKKEGTYTIAGVSMSCGGTIEGQTDPITITVAEGSAPKVDRDFYMRLSTNKTSVYRGEPFVLTLKYYSKVRPESFDALELGDAASIYRQDLNPDRQSFATAVESVNGVKYFVIELREEVCYAQRSGTLLIEPYFASLLFRRDFFNQFRKETYSNKLEIDVKPVPQNDNTNFKGLVGDFSIEADMSHDQVLMGDAVDINVTISGKGNFQSLGEIKLDLPSEFDEFDPNIEDKTTVSRSGLSGEIKYNFVVVPKHYGNYTIPAISFDYFDLKAKKMKRISTQDFQLKVDKREGVGPSDSPIPTEVADIHYIDEENNGFFENDDFIFGSLGYYGTLANPVLLSLLFIFIRRRKDNQSEEDLLKVQQKKAIKVAQTGLKETRQHLQTGDDKRALKSLQTTLINFFRQKFNVGLSELSQREITARLAENEVDDGLQNQFNQIWNAIEMGQYAPIAHANLIKTIDDTEGLIQALDKKI